MDIDILMCKPMGDQIHIMDGSWTVRENLESVITRGEDNELTHDEDIKTLTSEWKIRFFFSRNQRFVTKNYD